MRQSGILLHITSLPGPEGIGTLGDEARAFVDFLKDAGMRLWQVLPLGPTGYGESPYQCFSTYAGNPLMIDLRTLEAEGLLAPELQKTWASDSQVDFPAVIAYKERRLRAAFKQSRAQLAEQTAAFLQEQAHWLADYALFRAVKQRFGEGSWMDWPDQAIRMRHPEALKRYRTELADEVAYHVFVQYLFFRQWRALKAYANQQGIRLFGDMPIYVSMDSADIWQNPHCFMLDSERRPTWVAGVPPDYFSRDGQLWGNPLYDWKALKRTGYRWWVNRLRAMGDVFDLVRVDHFIGFANYYAVKHGASTARWGSWRVGPGRHFFQTVQRELPQLKIIAEDLGAVNQRVRKLLKYCGYPGMKVLSFAFSGGEHNIHLPQHVVKRSVYYTGTHDNDTVLGWWQKAEAEEQAEATRVMALKKTDSICDRMMDTVLESRADTAILPMQDILCLPGEARMNLPGSLGGNWLWRMKPGKLTKKLADDLKARNKRFGRSTP